MIVDISLISVIVSTVVIVVNFFFIMGGNLKKAATVSINIRLIIVFGVFFSDFSYFFFFLNNFNIRFQRV